MKNLARVLKQVGKPALVYRSPDGTRVLVLPHGGRILGLFPPRGEANFYWTNPALQSVATARAFFAGAQWHNSGGDRTWLAPEVDLFFPDYPRLDRYFQQRSLDPGNYRVIATAAGFQLVNRLTVGLSRAGKSAALKITKSLGPAPNPVRWERGLDLPEVEYAGYTQHTTLELAGRSRAIPAAIGLWNLVQMPHGGELLIPTYSRAEPRLVMGAIPPEDLVVDEHLIRYRMCRQGEHKISIRAVAVCGRVGYLYPSGETWSLIVRNFAVNPSGEYVDVPWNDAGYRGFSTQACAVDSGLGRFSELEYHIPAIGDGTGRTRCQDESQVWAFRGPEAQISQVCRLLCGWSPGSGS